MGVKTTHGVLRGVLYHFHTLKSLFEVIQNKPSLYQNFVVNEIYPLLH